MLAYFLLELLAIVASLLFVYWSKRAVDIVMGVAEGRVRYALSGVVLAVVVGVIVRMGSSWLEQHTSLKMNLKLQRQLNRDQLLSSWEFVKKWSTGDLMMRMQEDSQEVVQMISFKAMAFVVTGLRLLASFGFLWLMDPMLALMIVMITPLIVFSRLYFKRMQQITREVKSASSRLNHVIQENLRFRLLIRALGMIERREEKLEEQQQEVYSLRMQQVNFGLLTNGIMKAVINGGYLITFVWGIYRLQTQEISFGTMTAFLQLVGRIQTPALSMMAFVPMFIRFRVAMDRILSILGGGRKEEEPELVLETVDRIDLQSITFRYEDNTVIDRLSATLRANEITAIVGSSGKGKTTLIRLLLSLIEVEEGAIALRSEGQSFPLGAALRNNFSYVPQGNSLFTGTIRENLQMGAAGDSAEEEALARAIYQAHAEFIYTLPDGLDTRVGESGNGLSEGQAQRVSIARAMMRERPIWLFDEATSALDEESSRVLFERLSDARQGKMIILVTHDLKLAEKCDQIIYIH